ncbi:MAG: phage tail protein [Burkholderiales bacterium]|nr:phage tail protein [Burkholderiales bacterium]
MSAPFLGEVKIFAGNFAPRGYALCNGQLLPISQATALFSLLGTTYGGDGRSNFQLPNLQASAPVHAGQGNGLPPIQLGETGGEAGVTLLTSQIPAHTHQLEAAAAATTGTPSPGVALAATTGAQYTAPSNLTQMAAPLAANGGSQPHENRQPYLGLTFIIALQGIFPARN